MSGVNTNMGAAITINALAQNQKDMERAMQRLATGKRINSAQDDAAGLAVASRMSAQINGLNQAIQNCSAGCFHGGSSGGRNCRNIKHVT